MYEVPPSTMKIYLAYFLLWGFISNQKSVKATEVEPSASALADSSSVNNDASVLDSSSNRWSAGDDQKSIDSKSSNSVEAKSDGEILAKAILSKPVGPKNEVGSTNSSYGEINPVLQDDHVPESGGASFEATSKGQTKEESKVVQTRAMEDKANDETKPRVKAEVEAKAETEAKAEAKAEVEHEAKTKAEEEDRARVIKEARTRAEVEGRVQTEVVRRALAQAKAEAKIQASKAAKAKANAFAKAEAYLKASLIANVTATDAAEKMKRAVAERMKATIKSAAAQAALSDEETASMRAVVSAAAVQAAQMQALMAAQAGAIAQKKSFFQALTAGQMITANALVAGALERKAIVAKRRFDEAANETQAAISVQSMATDETSAATLIQNEALTAAIATNVLQIVALAEANAALQDIIAVDVRHAELSIPEKEPFEIIYPY